MLVSLEPSWMSTKPKLSPLIPIQAHLIHLNAHCLWPHLNSHYDPTSSPLGHAHMVPLDAFLAQLTAYRSSLGPVGFTSYLIVPIAPY